MSITTVEQMRCAARNLVLAALGAHLPGRAATRTDPMITMPAE